MNKYIPFLKLKANEVGALSSLFGDVKSVVYPFFDFPKTEPISEEAFVKNAERCAKSIKKNLNGIRGFFLDNFDISDAIKINGLDNYASILDAFSELNFVPVIGLDRAAGRNSLVFQKKKDGIVTSDTIALRLQADDFENFDLVKSQILDIVRSGIGLFQNWVLILDNRICQNINISHRAQIISNFITRASTETSFTVFVVTGSSLPASIRDIQGVSSEKNHERAEVMIFRSLSGDVRALDTYIGDYTIVSPLYSDLEIPAEMMQNVTAPKVIYSHDRFHYIARGAAIKTHASGLKQYNDIAKQIILKKFYRTPSYSFGDEFLNQKAHGIGKSVTPGSILKPTINAHITYMTKDFKP